MKEAEVKQIIEAKGYNFDGIVEFAKTDRIRWHTKDLEVAINLGKKVRDLTPEEFKRWVL